MRKPMSFCVKKWCIVTCGTVFKSCCLYLQGLDDEYQEEGKLLGDYTYQEDGESLQIFPVMVKYIHTEYAVV